MIKHLFSLMVPRVLRFRKEVVILWRALWSPATPLYLKAATIFAVLYLVTPTDLLPDVVPFVGLVDDVIIVQLIVSWIVSRLPVPAKAHAHAHPRTHRDGPIIDGTARPRG